MKILPALLVTLGIAILPMAPAHAGEAHYAELLLSDAKDGEPKETFTPDTPVIYVRARLVDVPVGAKLKAVWIAEKTQVVPPNHPVAAAEFERDPVIGFADFWLSRPDKGWPVGDYRVELMIDGKVMNNFRFRVTQ